MKTMLFITAVIFVGMVCFADAVPSFAQDKGRENVDAIIQGFEEKPPDDVDPEDVIRGFDNEPKDPSKKPAREDDILQGFDEKPEQGRSSESAEVKTASWHFEGELALSSAYNVSPDAKSPWQGFSMLRPELELTLKNRFSDKWQGQISVRGFYDAVYESRGRDEYTQAVLDEYESELELTDTFMQGRLTAHLDTKIGRQIVVWGTLDNLRVTDVLNPLDLRVPGLTDIEDLRLPVTMFKFDYYFGNWNVGAMAIPEVRFGKRPVYGSDFYPSAQASPPEDVPDDGFQDMQYAAAVTGVFSGWDIGFYGADIYSDQSYAEVTAPGPPVTVLRKHARVKMLGTAANFAAGNWLLKAEAAWFDGLRYTNTPGVEYNRLDVGGGAEYSGFSEATVSLEGVNRHICDYRSSLAQYPDELRENEFQWVLRFSKDLMNDTLTLTLLASTFGVKADDGSYERLDAEYDITDAVSIRGGGGLVSVGRQGAV